jgi:ferric-chelate reductase [NAD(P)H]
MMPRRNDAVENRLDPKALFSLSYGVYIVSAPYESGCPSGCNGQIANAVMQVTGEPPCLAVCLHKDNLTTECVSREGVFSVAVLEEAVPMTFIGNFGFKCGRDLDKFEKVAFRKGITGSPLVLDWTLSVMEAEVVRTLDVFTHTLFVGEVVASETLKEGVPLTYANYHLIKKGKSPKRAPTFIFNELK